MAVAGDVFDGVFLCCPFFPRAILDEIWDLIESVSGGGGGGGGGGSTYFCVRAGLN